MLICVDLDGTLLDTVPANAASYRAALEEMGFTVTDEYYAASCNGGHYTRFLRPLADNERLPVPGGIPVLVETVHDSIKSHAAVPKLKYPPDNSRFFLVDAERTTSNFIPHRCSTARISATGGFNCSASARALVDVVSLHFGARQGERLEHPGKYTELPEVLADAD